MSTTRNQTVLTKLAGVLGAARAEEVYDRAMHDAGIAQVDSPDERLRFGIALVKQGGVLEAIGRAIKIQAILHGAQEHAA